MTMVTFFRTAVLYPWVCGGKQGTNPCGRFSNAQLLREPDSAEEGQGVGSRDSWKL